MADMFANAPKVSSKPSGAKKPKTDDIQIDGLETYAAIDAMIKALTGLKSTYETGVKQQMADHFLMAGITLCKRPPNVNGREGRAKASLQLKIRSSRSAASEEEIAFLEEHGIEVVKEDDVVDTFIFNPKYAGETKLLMQINNVLTGVRDPKLMLKLSKAIKDEKLLAEVEEALGGVKDLPSDLIMKQEGKSRMVVPDDALDRIFRLTQRDKKGKPTTTPLDPATVAQLLKICGQLSVTPKIESDNEKDAMTHIFSVIKNTLGIEDEEPREVMAGDRVPPGLGLAR